MSDKRKVIISYALAKELIKLGFSIIDIEPNNKDSKRTIFIFEKTDSLTTYLQHRKEMKDNGRKENKLYSNTK